MDENSKSEAGWRDEHRKGKTSTQQTLFAISKQSEKAFIQLKREEVEVCVGGWVEKRQRQFHQHLQEHQAAGELEGCRAHVDATRQYYNNPQSQLFF